MPPDRKARQHRGKAVVLPARLGQKVEPRDPSRDWTAPSRLRHPWGLGKGIGSHNSPQRCLPLALIFYFDNVLLVAWCELRHAFRHFRVDRLPVCRVTGETFFGMGKPLREEWNATQRSATVES